MLISEFFPTNVGFFRLPALTLRKGNITVSVENKAKKGILAMLITTDILFGILDENYKVHRYGSWMGKETLHFPVFYRDDIAVRPGGTYVLTDEDILSLPDEKCLYICVGSQPEDLEKSISGEIFFVGGSKADPLNIFNFIQLFFEKLSNWECGLEGILSRGADIRQMVEISIPVFENRIIVVDYELRVIAHCRCDESGRISMSEKYEEVPQEKSAVFKNAYASSRSVRRPFYYNDEDGESYCINLYVNNNYAGTCSLTSDIRALKKNDMTFFQMFAGYIQRAIEKQSGSPGSRFITVKTIFSRLLEDHPVSRTDAEKAFEAGGRSLEAGEDHFYCIAVRNADRSKTLPGQYLCSILEKLLADCTAIPYEKTLAVLYMPDPKNLPDVRKYLDEKLLPYLKDMNFQAGVSERFSDIYKAKDFYAQACKVLEAETGGPLDKYINYFSDHALKYMLEHCCGEFEAEEMMPQGLTELIRHDKGSRYVDTLKCYLDNECNASRTAKQMFLHRSTLMPRLEKIRSYVRLDTPKERLYLRICLYLLEGRRT